jgi:hypothetical protein
MAQNQKQISNIRESLQIDIERVCMVEKCFILKVEHEIAHMDNQQSDGSPSRADKKP